MLRVAGYIRVSHKVQYWMLGLGMYQEDSVFVLSDAGYLGVYDSKGPLECREFVPLTVIVHVAL